MLTVLILEYIEAVYAKIRYLGENVLGIRMVGYIDGKGGIEVEKDCR